MDGGTRRPRSWPAMSPRRQRRIACLVTGIAAFAVLGPTAMAYVDASTQLPEPRRTHLEASQALTALRVALESEPTPSPNHP